MAGPQLAEPVVAEATRAWRRHWTQWRAVPLRARFYVTCVVVCAVVLTAWSVPAMAAHSGALLLFVLFVAASVVNVELGRWLEGGRLEHDRTHKAMSAWPFTAALLLPPGAAGLIALIGYAHMRARGIRIALWKWVLSWAAVTTGSAGATGALNLVDGGLLAPAGSTRTVLAIVTATVAFLGIETLVFFGISRFNSPDDEVHLRRALAHPDFYLTELVVLAGAATAAVLARYAPAAILFTVPGYVQLQRAVIYRALREEARIDRKTGLLNSETWRSDAVTALARSQRTGRKLAVLLADLDHFKAVNDTYGHLTGDEVLAATAHALTELVRGGDLVGRFGGEEFCILLHDAGPAEARAAAERIVTGIRALTFDRPELRITISIGVAVADRSQPGTLSELVAAADERLYQAKAGGRDRACG
jgi:diguanylate cyclase (GGDEF)-like protein